MYQAEVTPCVKLTVEVVRGRNIAKDLDCRKPACKPDPYVKIYIRDSPGAHRQTRRIKNSRNPEWKETFTFWLAHDLSEALAEITLMDSNTLINESMGSVNFELSSLNTNETVTKTFDFNETSQVEIEFTTENRCQSDLRLGKSLCNKEESFRKERKQKIFNSMRELLKKHGKHRRPLTVNEVPVIGVLGSGGGFRASVGYAGVMKALHDTGILDCCMYVNGLSGSSWYLSALYANETFPENGPDGTHNDIRKRLERNPYLGLLCEFLSYRDAAIAKKMAKQPVSYTDIFGMVIGNALLGREKMERTKLSHFQEKIRSGNAPMPILTAVHVNSNQPAAIFHDWLEFNPYEIGIAKYGCFMNTKQFGTKFFCGVQAKKFEENPLHYIMGICGSAYSILFKDYLKEYTKGNRFLSFLLKPIVADSEEPDEKQVKEASKKFNLYEDDLAGEDYNTVVLRTVAVASGYNHDDDTDEEATEEDKIKARKNRLARRDYLKKEENDIPTAMPKPSTEHSENGPNSSKPVDPYSMPIDLDPITAFATPPIDGGIVPESVIDHALIGGIENGYSTDESEEEKEEENQPPRFGCRKLVYEKIFGMDHLRTRGLRTARVFNYMRSMSINKTHPVIKHPHNQGLRKLFKRINKQLNVNKKKMFVADAGIAFNSPYPPMLRRERGVDIILSFDFSARKEDDMDPLKELYLAEEWARITGLPFPKISRDTYKKGLKECYVFRDEEDIKAPIVIHFVLCNINFRKYSAPGIPREQGDDRGEFNIFSINGEPIPKNPYKTFNFCYSKDEFDKLFQLMHFNTLLHLDTILEQILAYTARYDDE
ncbi:cytosolic phospholipase A2-like isoform X2 [Clavelina lepadiformis]|uniref:cytosolic phospholipase A2-like isoform X2 n=1 Tax=Clavelina lepadiformis TaxID=159417 RepID=UPI004041AFF3